MSFAAEFRMPGAYHFDSQTAPGHSLNAGIFRPPVSPSASTYNLAKSTGSLYSDISMSNGGTINGKRKRLGTRESTPMEWNMNMDGDAREEERGRYTLAGQIDATPLGPPSRVEEASLDDSMYSDFDYRRALGPKRSHEDAHSTPVRQTDSRRESQNASTPNSSGWTTFLGDVVGKVWEFCKNGAFRGFQAGGGKAYDANGAATSSQPPSQGSQTWCNEHDVPTLQTAQSSFRGKIPGYFPQSQSNSQEDYRPHKDIGFHDMNTPESTPRPVVKRRQVSENLDDLKRNWVMVDDELQQNQGVKKYPPFMTAASTAGSRPTSRMGPRHSGYHVQTAASANRRINVPVSRRTTLSTLRISHAGSPNLTPREPASFASPRSPVRPSTPSSRIPVPSSPRPGGFAHNNHSHFSFPAATAASSRPSSRQSRHLMSPAPLLQADHRPQSPATSPHRRNRSAASAAIPMRRGKTEIDVDDIQASPRLTNEAKQLAHRKLAVERDAEARVDVFNARLLQMIRQGKEALGTRVEVLGDDGDGGGGWEDDDE
ncbi:hypothetical protein QBC46DRAFT_72861 [Diplogelasinospora grovesii]|uniref:Uncharacterized protein n=1 Tax=Diplogelasinospora grovesii TaxID=303347 RepID=A0AAN6MXE4_9PEZI|nr:hypothetical protein QBC46DRAFT_72861 [Diplogelasinospora grovesii]